jgi:GntR family transcriptional regulator, transcriptional repressor for pyruvate dehydrogenase complex
MTKGGWAVTDGGLPRVQRKTLAQQAAELIVAHIDQERLPAGALLPSEGQLAGHFGVSRPIVREALRLLEANGVVTVVNGRGAMVKALNGDVLAAFFQRAARNRREAFREVLEVRRGIEVECAALAARRRTPEQLARLEEIVGQMRACLHDQTALTELDVAFHWQIAQASGNDLFVHLIESLRVVLEDSIRKRPVSRAAVTASLFEEVQRSHERIVAAIAAGDGATASEVMARHIDLGVELLLDE